MFISFILSFRFVVAGMMLGQIAIDPYLDKAFLIEADHFGFGFKVAVLLEELIEPLDGRVEYAHSFFDRNIFYLG